MLLPLLMQQYMYEFVACFLNSFILSGSLEALLTSYYFTSRILYKANTGFELLTIATKVIKMP